MIFLAPKSQVFHLVSFAFGRRSWTPLGDTCLVAQRRWSQSAEAEAEEQQAKWARSGREAGAKRARSGREAGAKRAKGFGARIRFR